MSPGLHIGLAGWLSAVQSSEGFYTSTVVPQAINLVDLEAIQSMEDLSKVSDFSTLTNAIPKQGQLISDSSVLWRKHRQILETMQFALRPWTQLEREQYDGAVNFLYTLDPDGHRVPSEQYLLYQEMKSVYESQVLSGGAQVDIQSAMADWIAIGYKMEVEHALMVIDQLTARTSITSAQDEKLSLAEPTGAALLHQSNSHFAPVYFSPISAIDQTTWLRAEVTFSEIDDCMAGTDFVSSWQSYRANKHGSITFKYAILQCHRPWFSNSIYEANDWILPTGHEKVSKGNGVEGQLPAYIDAVFLVSIESIKLTKPKPNPAIGIRHPRSRRLLANDTRGIQVGNKILSANKHARLSEASMINQEVRRKSTSPLSPVSPRVMLKPSNRTSLKVKPTLMLTALAVNSRMAIASSLLQRRNGQNTSRTSQSSHESSPTYIVGYGCKILAYAPNPNPHYEW